MYKMMYIYHIEQCIFYMPTCSFLAFIARKLTKILLDLTLIRFLRALFSSRP